MALASKMVPFFAENLRQICENFAQKIANLRQLCGKFAAIKMIIFQGYQFCGIIAENLLYFCAKIANLRQKCGKFAVIKISTI